MCFLNILSEVSFPALFMTEQTYSHLKGMLFMQPISQTQAGTLLGYILKHLHLEIRKPVFKFSTLPLALGALL